MASVTLSGISIYPIKSTAGQVLDQSEVEARGLSGDRRWMVVDPDGRFLTGRQLPRLTLIHTRHEETGLTLSKPGAASMRVRIPDPSSTNHSVVVWQDQVAAWDAGDQAAHWLSDFLERECRLMYMAEQHQRPVEAGHSKPGDIVSFADAFPLLLISEASLEDLNSRLKRKVSMAHFRPNLVIKGCAAYAEDQWRRIRIGKIEFDLVKACSRCVFTTVNPENGEQYADGQPLRALADYRRDDRGRVLFGVNLIARGAGQLSCSDLLTVLDWAKP